jgi:hypothetical protein
MVAPIYVHVREHEEQTKFWEVCPPSVFFLHPPLKLSQPMGTDEHSFSLNLFFFLKTYFQKHAHVHDYTLDNHHTTLFKKLKKYVWKINQVEVCFNV